MSGPGMSLDMRVSQRLEQRTVLSLQTIQSLKLLQMATVDLHELINNEMLENPTLEMSAEDPPEAPTELEQQQQLRDEIAEAEPQPTTEAGESYEEVYDFLQKHTDVDEFVSRSAKPPQDEDGDAKQEAFAQVAAQGRQLPDHLMEQVRLLNIDEIDLPLIEEIVYSLDPRGYLSYPLEDIVRALENRYTLEEADWALGVVQSLEPRGVGARDLAECLLLQIGKDDPDYDKLKRLLTDLWDDVLKNRVPKIAKDMGITIEEAKLLIDLLGGLNPHPGAIYNETPTQVVSPDVIVTQDDNGNFIVKLTRENLPRLSISPTYLRMLEQRKADKEALNFIKGKVNHAKQLIEALEQRQSTLERVANSIVRRQQDYLRWGLSALKPMKMQDIADELGIHHSTVWRAVYSKYMQTPQGVVAMNELFTGGLPMDDGETSREAVKLKVKEIVDGEEKAKPLSDMAIAKKLADAGIQASRRVVTKYREELGIADSRVRKAH
ncbi:MAG: RNA polymerase factor sigma-54 [Planctomycetes bacterium]|nr:RNA polymerase factor sigma-54 [Planctomycetota bacterium]MCW8135408.1 RNA polymerase factor sigma-54 [Planctomycetota bacterium]